MWLSEQIVGESSGKSQLHWGRSLEQSEAGGTCCYWFGIIFFFVSSLTRKECNIEYSNAAFFIYGCETW
jgi:hypothetical protein